MVAPLLQFHEFPADAVNTTFPPWQNATAPPAVTVAVGNGLTVTLMADEVVVHPLVVTVTVYVPVVLTVIACVLAPLLQL